MSSHIVGSLTDTDEWLSSAYPCLNTDIDGNILFNLDIMETLIPIEQKSLYDLDIEKIEYVLDGTGWNVRNILDASESKIFSVGDLRAKVSDIFQSSFVEGSSFITDALRKGICEPYYLINTILEICLLSFREGIDEFNSFETLDELGIDINHKIFLSVLATLRTSVKHDMCVLRYHYDRGDFLDINLYRLFDDIYHENKSLKRLLVYIYRECVDMLMKTINFKKDFIIEPITTPDLRHTINKNFMYRTLTIKEI